MYEIGFFSSLINTFFYLFGRRIYVGRPRKFFAHPRGPRIDLVRVELKAVSEPAIERGKEASPRVNDLLEGRTRVFILSSPLRYLTGERDSKKSLFFMPFFSPSPCTCDETRQSRSY